MAFFHYLGLMIPIRQDYWSPSLQESFPPLEESTLEMLPRHARYILRTREEGTLVFSGHVKTAGTVLQHSSSSNGLSLAVNYHHTRT